MTFKSINAFTEPIKLLTNLSFVTRSFSSTLKQAYVIPIFKKDDHRPISLLSNISKIIDKHPMQLWHLNQFCDKQFGFRHGTFNSTCTLRNTQKISQPCVKKFLVCFFRSLKDFWHSKPQHFIKKTEHYSIRGITNKWFNLCLTDQIQFTTVQGKHSDNNPVY